MKKHLYFLLLPVLFLQNCSFLEQSDFIETKIISSDLNEKIIYKFYQTGIDDYKVDFYSVDESGSKKLFEHYISDALVTSSTYNISDSDDELIIRTKLFSDVKKFVTRNGKSIILTNR
ncbi:hypothetical protein SAMN05443633_11564 [Chryseobacterium arachidis]|uniref:Uncharacterized protein n=1 Tax=Chryseobacterium arachidis TaxID=1416778 RepID=A0A1M5JSG7_9FLAO|nr:hypothetical protein [Chryseobacterium arachidis]SHG43219.1 hypothetical protein SAMN05443633_11564 [Chryseobacterium arachidis]